MHCSRLLAPESTSKRQKSWGRDALHTLTHTQRHVCRDGRQRAWRWRRCSRAGLEGVYERELKNQLCQRVRNGPKFLAEKASNQGRREPLSATSPGALEHGSTLRTRPFARRIPPLCPFAQTNRKDRFFPMNSSFHSLTPLHPSRHQQQQALQLVDGESIITSSSTGAQFIHSPTSPAEGRRPARL